MRSVCSAYQRLQTIRMMETVPATLRTAPSTRPRNLCSDSVATKLTRWHVGGPRADKALADGTNTHIQKNTRKHRVLTRHWLMVRKHMYIHTLVLPLVTDTPAHICTHIHTHSHAHSRARALSLSPTSGVLGRILQASRGSHARQHLRLVFYKRCFHVRGAQIEVTIAIYFKYFK